MPDIRTGLVRPAARGLAALPVRRFAREARGSVAILFGICLIPLMLFVGAAVDYSYAAMTKSKLDTAIDAAALDTVSRSKLPSTAAAARDMGLKVFNAQAASVGRVQIEQTVIDVTDTSSDRKTVASYTAQVQTAFMGLIGKTSIAISGSSSAASTLAPYIDFYLLLDNSPSMGVGATPADVATLQANTPDKCAFACHITSATSDNYKLAKTLGVTMRIDVLRSATQQLMDTAVTTAFLPSQYRMAIHTFGPTCGDTTPTTVASLTTNLASAKSAAASIDLMSIPYQNFNNDQCTDFGAMLAALNSAIPTPGIGTQNAPQKVLFFVSDGVSDAYYPVACTKPTTNGRCQEPISQSYCTALKDRGVRIAVLYTTYLPLPADSWYNTWIAPFASQIGPSMQNCASPGLYFEVSPTQGISEAMNALFQKAVAQARFTN